MANNIPGSRKVKQPMKDQICQVESHFFGSLFPRMPLDRILPARGIGIELYYWCF